MRGQGWDVFVDPAGGISANIANEQVEPYQEAVDSCTEQLGFGVRPLTESEYTRLYADYVDGYGCLLEAGYSVTTPPSEATFIENYETAPWLPWSEIPSEELHRALALCPQPAEIY
jgi:hypothetical protein